MSKIIMAAVAVPIFAMNLDARGNSFLAVQSLQGDEFHASSGISTKLHDTIQGLAMDLLTENPTQGMASVRDGLKTISERMDLKTAVKTIKHKDLPADVQSLVMTASDGTHHSDFDEGSMTKARVALNDLVEKAWVDLDDKIIECKEYQEMNRATFDQVVTDISRLAEQITDLKRVESEAIAGGERTDSDIIAVESELTKEEQKYNSILAANTADLATKQNDLDVFQFILTFTRCPDATSLLQSNVSQTRICSIHGGERTMCFDDHHAQTRFNQMMSHASKHDISQILAEVDQPVMHGKEATSFLQWGQDPMAMETAMNADVVPVQGEEADTPGFVPAPFCCEAHGVACGSGGQGVMCSPDPPDCGLLHDKLSMMWGDYKDQVDELTMDMNKNEYLFEELKITLNDQISILTTSKSRFTQMLSESRSNLAADNEEVKSKNIQKEEVEKAFLHFMKKCCERVKWILFQDMCALIVVRNAVLETSTECPGASIVDCDVADWVSNKCDTECDDSCPDRPDASQVYTCGGWQSITRKVVVQPDACGLQCPAGTRTKKCNQKRCPVDCVMSAWSGWSKCTAECEGGVRSATRSLMTKPLNGGMSCNTNEVSEPCHTMSCDRDCKLADWTEWSPCSVACGGGDTTRVKHVLIPTRGYGKCEKESSFERLGEDSCNEQSCIGDEICIAEQDLVIAIDGSGSVQDSGFGVIKGFALALLERYRSEYYGKAAMKIGLVEFGNGIIMEDDVSVSPAMNLHVLSFDHASVKTALEGMVQKKGFTNMAQAFALAETMYTSAGRKGAQPALLVITDGKPSFQFQTRELSMQLADKGVQKFFAVVSEDKDAVKLMGTYASVPTDTNLLHIPGLAMLEADSVMWAERALTKFCPLSQSPTLVASQAEAVGWMHVMDSGYCGGRGQLLSKAVNDAEACETLALGAGCDSLLLGVWFRRGYCYCGQQTVTLGEFNTMAANLVAPACPGDVAPTSSMLFDWYAHQPALED